MRHLKLACVRRLTLPWLFLYRGPRVVLYCSWISAIHLNHLLEGSVSLHWLGKEPRKTNHLSLNIQASVSTPCPWLTPGMGSFFSLTRLVMNTKLVRVREHTALEDEGAFSGSCEVPSVQVWSISMWESVVKCRWRPAVRCHEELNLLLCMIKHMWASD